MLFRRTCGRFAAANDAQISTKDRALGRLLRTGGAGQESAKVRSSPLYGSGRSKEARLLEVNVTQPDGSREKYLAVRHSALHLECNVLSGFDLEAHKVMTGEEALLRLMAVRTSVACMRRFLWLRLGSKSKEHRRDPASFAAAVARAIGCCPFLHVDTPPRLHDLILAEKQPGGLVGLSAGSPTRALNTFADLWTDDWSLADHPREFARAHPAAAAAFESFDRDDLARFNEASQAEWAATGNDFTSPDPLGYSQWNPEDAIITFIAPPTRLGLLTRDEHLRVKTGPLQALFHSSSPVRDR
jgi:hypothetical protein